MRIDFVTRSTPHGCTVQLKTPRRTQRARFRNGYASARESAKKWITEQIGVIRELVDVDGLETPDIFVDGVPIAE